MALLLSEIAPEKIISVEVVTKGIVHHQLTVGHVRHYFENLDLTPLDWRAFRRVLQKIDQVDAEAPNGSQLEFIKSFDPEYHFLLLALSYQTNSYADFGPENAVQVMCMVNQQKGMLYDLSMGRTPQMLPVDPQFSHMKLAVCRGFAAISPNFQLGLEKVTHKNVEVVTPAVINFAVEVVMTQQLDAAGKVVPTQVLPNDIDLGKYFYNGMLKTSVNSIASQMLKGSKITGTQNLLRAMFKNASKIQTILECIPTEKCGPDHTQIQPEVLGFSNHKFEDVTFGGLCAYLDKFWKGLGKRKEIFKRSDCGDKSLNVAAKFSPVLSLISGSPFMMVNGKFPIQINPDFKISQTCCYFGAGGQRGRQAFDNRFVVSAYDIADPPEFKTEDIEKDFRNQGYKSWERKDIFQKKDYQGFDVFVSDIYMSSWNKSKGDDPKGHVFVNNVLQGKVINGEVVVTDQLPPIRVVKGFAPTSDYIKLYANSFPFVVANTSRPCTTELIYIKFPKIPSGEVFADLDRVYGKNVSNRFVIVSTMQEFEEFCKKKVIIVIKELNFQVRTLALNFNQVIGSIRNRDWWVSSGDLPRLYVSRKFGLAIHHGMSMSSDIYSSLYSLHEEYPDSDEIDVGIVIPRVSFNDNPNELLVDDSSLFQ